MTRISKANKFGENLSEKNPSPLWSSGSAPYFMVSVYNAIFGSTRNPIIDNSNRILLRMNYTLFEQFSMMTLFRCQDCCLLACIVLAYRTQYPMISFQLPILHYGIYDSLCYSINYAFSTQTSMLYVT